MNIRQRSILLTILGSILIGGTLGILIPSSPSEPSKIPIYEDSDTTTTPAPSYIYPQSYRIRMDRGKFIAEMPHGTVIKVCDTEEEAIRVIEITAEICREEYEQTGKF